MAKMNLNPLVYELERIADIIKILNTVPEYLARHRMVEYIRDYIGDHEHDDDNHYGSDEGPVP